MQRTRTPLKTRGGVPQSREHRNSDISHPQSYPPSAFLVPFQHVFHREIVRSAGGRKTVNYLTAEGVRLKSKKELVPHIKHLENVTEKNFTFTPTELSIIDLRNKCPLAKLTRVATQHLAPSHRGHTNLPMILPNQPRSLSNIERQTIIGTRARVGSNPRTFTSKKSLTQARTTPR